MKHTIIPVCSWHAHSKSTQNTQKCMKSLNYLSLLQFSLLLLNCEGSHSALIYKFKGVNSNDLHTCTHDRPASLEHVRGGGVSFVIAARVSTHPIHISSEHAPEMPLYSSIFGGME